ncbi:MAG: diguanylate cyclase (GGDEF)-like protein/PAS domain S-box-containing protein [Motiliproteus sp.]|jgi:diguanylate cyclase (GGDEF)-like protein/PAS domain S-box-containing protein
MMKELRPTGDMPGTPRPLILTIDDERVIRTSFSYFLEDLDYRVLQAADGEQGIAQIETAKPDLVLVDLRMPRNDGLDVLRWVKEQAPLLPVIVVSGTGVIGDVIEALTLGAWDYLLKPIQDLEMLRLAIERALEKAQLRRQAAGYQRRLEQEVAQRTLELQSANRELAIAASAFNTHDAILITDAEGHIIRANASMERLTGYSQAEMLDQTPRLWKSGRHDSAFYASLWDILIATGRWQGEIINRSRDGQQYPVWQSITAVQGDDARVDYYVAVATDLSELKAKERMLERLAQEERLLGEIAQLAMTFMDTDPFLCEVVTLIQQQLSELALLSQVQLWSSGVDGWTSRDILSLGREKVEAPSNQQLSRAVQSGKALSCVQVGRGSHLLIPLCSKRRDLGVLVLFSDTLGYQEAVAPFLARLGEVLTLAMLQQETERELHYQANHDSLTSLPNRQSLALLLGQQISSAQRRDERGVVLFLDLDNFKTLNDSLGHNQGDQLLQLLSHRLRETLRQEDILARLGGDEFVIVLPPRPLGAGETAEMAVHVAEKIKLLINRPFPLQGHDYMVGCSIGIAVFPDVGSNAEELLKRADSAMYLAKAAGRNSVRFYSPDLQQAADRRLDLEHRLRRAMTRFDLQPYFQPQLDQNGRLVGAEVLLRWHDEDDGWISPAEFIPVAESSGLILPIGNWLFDVVCERMAHWKALEGFDHLRSVSINISPNQFYQPGFADRVLGVVEKHGIAPESLMLEITEGVVLRNLEEAIEIMATLGRVGVKFSLDDFGTGYSSLAYLKRLPVDELKIDQSFILEIDKNPDDVKIVDAILSLANHFELTSVAEGVESEAAFKMLRARHCQVYQGYYFSRALPEAEFLAFMRLGAASG